MAVATTPEYKGKQVYVNLSASLLQQIDELAKYNCLSRSAQMRMALAAYARQPDNAAKLGLSNQQPGEDLELKRFNAKWIKEHPEAELEREDQDSNYFFGLNTRSKL